MHGFVITQTPHILGGTVFLLVFVAFISQATGHEANECDSDNTCWYVEQGMKTVSVRSWRCAWLWKCWTYKVSTRHSKPVCRCCPGWEGDAKDCTRCPDGQFGYECSRTCECTDGDLTQCDPRSGACFKEASFQEIDDTSCSSSMNCTNAQMCNPQNNTCDCPAMWRGEKCNIHSICPDGFYGELCGRECQCNDGTSQCDPLTGKCMCYGGWMGLTCNETCPQGSYGESCSMVCECPASALECDPVSGDCLCQAGYFGSSCSSECPDGRFGPSCQSPCTCDNSTETCNRINGTCIDKDNSEVTANDNYPLPNSSAGPVVVAVIASALIVALLVFVILFLRRSKQSTQTRATLVKNDPGIVQNPCYANPIDEGDMVTSSSPMPIQHFVVGGATYAVPDSATGDSSGCNVGGFEESYSHLQPTTVYSINPYQSRDQNDYSHLTRDDRQLQAKHPPPTDISNDARYAETTRVIQSKPNEYDNLNRGVKHPGGVKYEVVI
ncbi:protein draper-like [Asterias rubens]|uniref:protein draper-like n=1 Tax=Asterias rubens TaxID=7604 RepID=UPI001454E80B|nr:protein draper-like [Asterias rubens]